jgi:hypothetical protein
MAPGEKGVALQREQWETLESCLVQYERLLEQD